MQQLKCAVIYILLVGLFAHAHAQTWVTNGLVAYYPFTGNANDAVGTNHGTVFGATLATNRFGVASQCYSFDGTNAYIQCPDTGFPVAAAARTVSLWLKVDSFGAPSTITYPFSYGADGPTDAFYAIVDGLNSGGPYISVGRSGGGDAPRWQGPETNVWYHLAITYADTTTTIYVNATNQSAMRSYLTTASGNFYIGRYLAGFPPTFYGAIDDVRVYDRALSPSEVTDLYTLEATPPPAITNQPQSITVSVGVSTNFTVGATGSAPLSYQWFKDGVGLPGATTAQLAFVNVQPLNVGNYMAVVANIMGSATSSVASLTIPGVPTNLWQGLVAYYPFNGNAQDESGWGNHGMVSGASLGMDRFAATGNSYSFTGFDQHVDTGSAVGFPAGTNDFAISLWVALSFLTNDFQIVFCNSAVNDFQLDVWPSASGSAPMDFLTGGHYGSPDVHTADVPWVPNQWYNLQIVRSQNEVTIYRDGLIIGQNQTANGVNATPGSRNLRFGLGVPPQIHQLYGQIDDIRIYNRALSTSELAFITALAPPHITLQPQGHTVTGGSATNFNVTVTGSEPLSYQWFKDGAALPGASSATLTFPSVQPFNVGNYAVTVGNAVGSVTSTVVNLSIPGVPTWMWQGLVAYYPFNGNAHDESGYGRDGVVEGATLAVDRFGMPAKAYRFDDVNAGIRIGESPVTGPLTISAWIYKEGDSSTHDQIVCVTNAGGVYLNIYPVQNPALKNHIDFGANYSPTDRYFSPDPIALNTWVQVLATYDGQRVRLYEDGQLVADTPRTGGFSGGTMLIGRDGDATAIDVFRGVIDDVRIYNRALTTNEVGQLHAMESFCSPHRARATAVLAGDGVMAATMTDYGCGYTNPPSVRIVDGGGTGATAVANLANGVVTSLTITSAGSGYTNAPRILIESPPFEPTVGIQVSRVNVTQHVRVNHNYVLESSADAINWAPTGPSFTAESEEITNEFLVGQTGQYFRLREVP